MTVEEMRKKIEEHCDANVDENGFKRCEICPLFDLPGTACYESEVSDADIKNHYYVLFGKNPIKPEYYNDTKIAPIDVIEDWDLDFCLGSALKYIKRCGKKENNPSVQDLKKVIWYIERRIKELEEASKC